MRYVLAMALITIAPPVHAQDDAEAPLPPGAVRRLGETRYRPGVRVRYLAFDATGKTLASWGNWFHYEDRLSLWDVATGEELQTQAVGEELIAAMAWGEAGRGFAVTRNELARAAAPCSASGPLPIRPPSLRRRAASKASLSSRKKRTALEFYSHYAFTPGADRLAAFRSGGPGSQGYVDLFEAAPCASGMELKPPLTSAAPPNGHCIGLRFCRQDNAR